MSQRRLSPILLLVFLALPAAAQDAASPSPGSPASDEVLRQAMARIDEDDLEGAIGLLEELREAGDATPRAMAALGGLYLEIGLGGDALAVLGPLADAEGADAAVLYNAGRAALATGEDERGESYLERSVRAQPVSPAARLLGLRLGARGQTVVAYGLLRPWTQANPDDVEARLAAAVGAVQLERIPEAEDLLAGAPDDMPRVRLLRADLALKRRDPAAAVDLLASLMEQAEDFPPRMTTDIRVLLATAYLELGRSPDAIALLETDAAMSPRLSLYLARAQYQGGDVESALTTIGPWAQPLLDSEAEPPERERAVAASVLLELGRILVAAGRGQDAVAPLERATVLTPWNREVWQELSRSYAASGRREDAETAAKKLEEIAEARKQATIPGLKGQNRLNDPTGQRLEEAREWLARGEPEEALTVIRQEIALAPQDLRPRLFEVQILLGLGRKEEARQAIDAALEVHPDHPDAIHFRAIVHLSLGDGAAGEADLRRALEITPDHIPAMADLAMLHAGRGEKDEARRLLRRILELRPGDRLAQQRLAQIDKN